MNHPTIQTTIQNNVKGMKTISVEKFLSLEFNTLKDEKRDVKNLVNSIKKNGKEIIWQKK